MNNALKDKVRVLLVDDDEDDCLIIKRLFSNITMSPFELDTETDADSAIERINESRHDVYLIDYRLGAKTGLDILREVNAISRSEPFILLTGVGDREVELESVRLAASDYLVKKSLDSELLFRTIYYALGRKEIEQEKIKQLMELTRSKDEFISIASHQLRTPATAVKQYIGMVHDGFAGELNKKQRELLEKAYGSNERQLAIVNDLLRVAQIDAGGMELSLESANVSQLLEQTIDDLRHIFETRHQVLTVIVPENTTATIDSNAVRMVIDNLLDNASKYSSEHSIITIELEKSHASVKIMVSDNGVGVDAPDRLFQKFSRIDNPLSTQVGGTGLGLYWAQSIAQLHGGDLSYRANKPNGSVFTLELPL